MVVSSQEKNVQAGLKDGVVYITIACNISSVGNGDANSRNRVSFIQGG
jgi:hypothetical protein